MTDEYKFTTDWFKWAPPVWSQLTPHLPARKKFLEIGSFEGRSTVWIIENMLEDGGKILCVDTWEGGEEHNTKTMDGVEDRFHHNITVIRKKFPERGVYSFRAKSTETLGAMNTGTRDIGTFDFIYVDGSHVAKDVLTDACMAWPLLKVGGFMAFDDYMWNPPGFTTIHRPKIAIDAFTTLFEEDLTFVHMGYQLIVRKDK